MIAVRAITLLFAVPILLWAILPQRAWPHDAVTGWQYPYECCSAADCYEITERDVRPVPGGWLIVATGEVRPADKTRQSPDGRYHRCSTAGDPKASTICLFVPPFEG